MKERFVESFAILLAGLFSAERPKPWSLGLAARAHGAEDEPAAEDDSDSPSEKN